MKSVIVNSLLTSLTCLILFSCNKNRDNELTEKKILKGYALEWYDLNDENPRIIKLPDELNEISGMCFTGGGRLFCHGDEDADMFEFDMESGTIRAKFYVGKPILNTSEQGDFEDVAWVNDRFYLLKSKGKIYEFPEGKQQEHVPFKIYDTKLNEDNDAEGLCYDPETNALLIACKGDPGKGYKNSRTVYSFSLKSMSLSDSPRFVIPLDSIQGEFRPSGISRHPSAGTFFIISAAGNTIIELSKSGGILGQKELPKKIHAQPEGIAFDRDYNLIISNEGKNHSARIILYPMKK